MKNYFLCFSFLICINSFSLRISYNNCPITNVYEYNDFLTNIDNDNRCRDYIAIRDRIINSIADRGPLISSNREVFGAHGSNYDFDENGYSPLTMEHVSKGLHIGDLYKAPGKVDMVFSHLSILIPQLDANGMLLDTIRICAPITTYPILERASIDEINDFSNSFYAYSPNIHLASNWGRYSKSFVVKCSPTLDDPSTQPVLRFNIDDDANFPIKFRTFSGDSCFAFFMVTADNKLKVVGTHSPADDHFLVENIAYPATAAFIDKLIEKDNKVNDLVARGVLDPKDPNFYNLIKDVDKIRDPVRPVSAPNLSNSNRIQSQFTPSVESSIDSEDVGETPVPEPLSVLTLGMGLGALIKNRCKDKK